MMRLCPDMDQNITKEACGHRRATERRKTMLFDLVFGLLGTFLNFAFEFFGFIFVHFILPLIGIALVILALYILFSVIRDKVDPPPALKETQPPNLRIGSSDQCANCFYFGREMGDGVSHLCTRHHVCVVQSEVCDDFESHFDILFGNH